MTGALVTAALIASALLLTLVVPRVLARWRPQRADPARALLLWQAISITGVVSALLAAPVAVLTSGLRQPLLLGLALALSGLMLARVLWSGHRVGTDLRRLRDEHRTMVDVLGERLEGLEDGPQGGFHGAVADPVRVLDHPAPTAFCLPGKGDRIVLSRAAVERLGPEELRAVLAHEHAHLAHRHDLLLELFTVLHKAVPAQVRAHAALHEVHLLAEVLADHRAADRASAPALARALVAMATPADDLAPARPSDDLASGEADPQRGPRVQHALGPSDDLAPGEADPQSGPRVQHALGAAETQVGTRLRLLAQPRATAPLRLALTGGATAVLLLPAALLALLCWT